MALSRLPANFSLQFLKLQISFKAKQQGYKFFTEGYIYNVEINNVNDISVQISSHCYRSQRKSEKPHKECLDLGQEEITESWCSCQAG